jgi:hypothetical protein
LVYGFDNGFRLTGLDAAESKEAARDFIKRELFMSKRRVGVQDRNWQIQSFRKCLVHHVIFLQNTRPAPGVEGEIRRILCFKNFSK